MTPKINSEVDDIMSELDGFVAYARQRELGKGGKYFVPVPDRLPKRAA